MFRPLSTAVAFVMGLWLVWLFQAVIVRNVFGLEWDLEKIGQLGDSFGILSSLFASLGAAAALYTLRMQQRHIARDQFDKTFFELLSLFGEARDRVNFAHSQDLLGKRQLYFRTNLLGRRIEDNSPKSATGIAAFQLAWLEIKHWTPETQLPSNRIVENYEKYVHTRSENTFGPYFRILYTILRRIRDDINLADEDRILYGNLIRGQLSQDEAAIAGVNGLSSISKDFKDVVVYFRLLKYTTGTRRKILMLHYPERTFQGRDK